jgi:phosphoribosylformylglycinamidine synthase
MSLDVLFGNTPSTQRTYKFSKKRNKTLIIKNNNLEKLLFKVLRHPSVASKSYLITIGDRTITGLVCRDQMVGPWQIPVADNAVTLAGYKGLSGEAMSIGEKSPLAISNAAASARMAVAESITNLISSGVKNISDIVGSKN